MKGSIILWVCNPESLEPSSHLPTREKWEMPASKDCPAVLAAIPYVSGTQSQGPGKFSATLCFPICRGTLTFQQERLIPNYFRWFPK